jgi:hypothetical protein
MEKGVGRCYLCSSQRELEESHIWPRFAYKEYVASQETGGRFTDLQSLSRHNRQLKKSWMCRSCEQLLNKFETPTAAFLRRINPNSDGPFAYGRYLLPFSVSLSWRVANYYVPQATKPVYADVLRPAMRRWRQFLLGRSRNLGVFSTMRSLPSVRTSTARTPSSTADWEARCSIRKGCSYGVWVRSSSFLFLTGINFPPQKHESSAKVNSKQAEV